MSRAPRKEYNLQAIQLPNETNYVPSEARDPSFIRLFAGKAPGIRIAWQQHAGVNAMAETLAKVHEDGDEADQESAATIFALASVGTAYHTVAEGMLDKRMHFRVRLPSMMEQGVRLTHNDLMDQAHEGLAHAAGLSLQILEMTNERQNTKKVSEKLGRSLARIGMGLAAVADTVPDMRLDEAGMQEAAYHAAGKIHHESIRLSGQISARPSVAQLADYQSPLRHHMYESRHFATDMVLNSVDASVKRSIANGA